LNRRCLNTMRIERFFPSYSASAIADLRERLRHTRWPDVVPNSGWEYGTDLAFMKEICDYWCDGFDWARQMERISAFHHYLATADGLRIHFIHERGQGPNPLPLILTHGWPGSFLEMLKIVPLLTDPAGHGADPADAFDVVVPSLPGYGFSARPGAGMNVFAIAGLWADLMGALGYSRFAAQGGDIGAGVSTALGLRHPDRILGIHLNFIPGSYRPYLAPDTKLDGTEGEFLGEVVRWSERMGAYAHIQRTTPLTAAYGLNDSPAGLAAWILEKFRLWSDCGGDLLRRFTRDELLANVTLYWMTETIHSSFRVYYEGAKTPLSFATGEFVRAPCAIAHFPREILFPPRAWVERGYNVKRWTEMPRGGHFAAAEEPELLAEDLRRFFRGLR
jgi:pimeloyl-ACP methyl ester carboxylesterase